MSMFPYENSFETEGTSHLEMAYDIHSIYSIIQEQSKRDLLDNFSKRDQTKLSNMMNVLTAHSFGI